jgi:hypothetical protein
MPNEIFLNYIITRSYIGWYDYDVCFVLDQDARPTLEPTIYHTHGEHSNPQSTALRRTLEPLHH